MDEHTLRIVDFTRIRQMLAELTITEPGKREVERLHPGNERSVIEHEYALTRELLAVGDEPPLAGVVDISGLLSSGNDEGTILSPVELLTVCRTLVALAGVSDFLTRRKGKSPLVAQECAGIRAFPGLVSAINQVLTETGEVKDDASPELKRIRTRLRRLRREVVAALEQTLSASPDLFQDQNVSVRSGRFVLPVKTEARNRFEGVVHDSSDSGRTLFAEPLALMSEQNEIARLHGAETEEVQRILRALTQKVRQEAEAIGRALKSVARLDLLNARKRFAVRYNAVQPVISDRRAIQLIGVRHPLLEGRKNDVVPLTFVLPDDARVVLISGPNAGGKTVAMKTIGLMAIMMTAGFFLPAQEGTELPLFRRIYADIGDEQTLEGALSSFSAHLLRTKQILEQADNESLVLLDEIGGSTSPEEGSALAIAVLEQLYRQGTVTIATSHLGPLKAFVQDAQGMTNAAMEFRNQPTYRLLMGVPGESSALEMSKNLGFPSEVLERARTFLNQDWLQVSERLQELTRELDKVKRLRRETNHEKELALASRQEWQMKERRFQEYEAAERQKLRAQYEELLRSTRREIENLVREIREQKATHQTIKAAKEYVEKKLAQAAEATGDEQQATSAPRAVTAYEPPQVGDDVASRTFVRQGTVVALEGDQATVAFGNIKMKLKLADLRVVRRAAPEPQPEPLVGGEEFDPRLKILGMTRDEAQQALARFLDQAELYGAYTVAILHGKGSGVLRKMLWEQLRQDRRIAEIRLGEPNEGGSGITFVKFLR